MEDKCTHILVLIWFMRAQAAQLSRLTLAVVTGRLQSLTPATPGNASSTFLCHVHDVLHHSASGLTSADPRFFFETVSLGKDAWLNLDWWEHVIQVPHFGATQVSMTGTLVSTWGDGSGTRMGGTKQFYALTSPPSPMEMWMGVWSVSVQGGNTSNWKELRTLLETLRRDCTTGIFRGVLLLCFTDSEVTRALILQGSSREPALQALLQEIKELEIALECRVLPIHVPGRRMICQGTDDLSRGIWITPVRAQLSPEEETVGVFNTMAATPAAIAWLQEVVMLVSTMTTHGDWHLIDMDIEWQRRRWHHESLLCFPPLTWRARSSLRYSSSGLNP